MGKFKHGPKGSSEKINEKRILQFENEILGSRGLIEINKGSFYSDLIGTGLDPIKTQAELKDTFLRIAQKTKDPDISSAFKWVSGFQTDARAREFLQEVSPEGFAGLGL